MHTIRKSNSTRRRWFAFSARAGGLMPTPFEAELHSLLRDLGDIGQVADDLLRRWKLNLLNEQELEECALFLLNSGLHQRFFEAVKDSLKKKARIPWAAFAEAIGDMRVKLSDLEVQALMKGALSQAAELELARSRKLEKQGQPFAELRARWQAERALRIEQRRKDLKEKIQFMRAGRMYEEEEKVLREMEAVFPDDSEFARERESFELRWAREIIARSTHQATTPTSDLLWQIEKLTPEQKTSKGLIVERAMEIARSHPYLAYDLALCLHFMDFNAEAVGILDSVHPRMDIAEPAPSHAPRVDWLRLELMLQARQFVSALEEASRLELAYAGDPEAAFSVVYARARALKGLGQDSMAVDLMKSLVKIRPSYKSAHSLLLDWSGDDE